jgi:hypothetical protein
MSKIGHISRPLLPKRPNAAGKHTGEPEPCECWQFVDLALYTDLDQRHLATRDVPEALRLARGKGVCPA